MENNINYGVIETTPQPGDYIAGSALTIPFEARNTLADWRMFESAYERQSDSTFDTQACVTFSNVLGCIAPQLNWMLTNNLLPSTTHDWLEASGYIVNGKAALSERFIAVTSGTGPNGNSGQNVAQAIRTYGIPAESTWPNLLDQGVNHDTFYEPIPGVVKDKALEWNNHFTVKWEFFTNRALLRHYLQQSPVQLYVPVCYNFFVDPIVKTCNQPMQHAVALHAVDKYGNLIVEDQYPSFLKKLAPNYKIDAFMRIVLYPNPHL